MTGCGTTWGAFRNRKGTVDSIAQFNHRIAPSGTHSITPASSPTCSASCFTYCQIASDYLREKVWEPIGAEADAKWLIDAEGFELAHFGFNAVLRDYARLGRLLAHDGAWDGKQIAPAQWMIDATTARPSDC